MTFQVDLSLLPISSLKISADTNLLRRPCCSSGLSLCGKSDHRFSLCLTARNSSHHGFKKEKKGDGTSLGVLSFFEVTDLWLGQIVSALSVE